MEDANDMVSEFAGYTAMQFIALADKVAVLVTSRLPKVCAKTVR